MSREMGRLGLMLMLLLLVGCGGIPERPGSVADIGPAWPPDPLLTLRYGDRDRLFRLHLPAGDNGRQPRPLVVMLHGAMGNGALFAERTGFNRIADREGVIVAYPYGTGWSEQRLLTWNAGYCCFYARDHRVDDAGFVAALIDRLQSDYPVDPQRIYLAGFSNGGMLALRLAAQMGRHIAAVAAVAGTIGGREASGTPFIASPSPKGMPSVLLIHGLADEQVPYDGGRGRKTIGSRMDASVEQALDLWSRNNRCRPQPRRIAMASGRVERWDYLCRGGALVLYRLLSGGHSWPGGEAVSGWSMEEMAVRLLLDNPSRDIDASEVIWRFFREHPADSVSRHSVRVDPAPFE